MEERLNYERLMIRAFKCANRFELRIANADFFDRHSAAEIAVAMMAAFRVLLNEGYQHKDYLREAIKQLESNMESIKVIQELLACMPAEFL